MEEHFLLGYRSDKGCGSEHVPFVEGEEGGEVLEMEFGSDIQLSRGVGGHEVFHHGPVLSGKGSISG